MNCKPALILIALLLAACAGADGPPTVALDRTACAHCGMLVSDLRYAAALRLRPGEEARVFDDIGCMLQEWPRTGDGATAAAWAMDVDGTWIDAREATFVRGAIRTPMGGGIVAFRDPQAAAEYAAIVSDARVVKFADLLAEDNPESKVEGGS